jgi:hypothetical protein
VKEVEQIFLRWFIQQEWILSTGFKIFTSDILVHGLTIGRGSGADSTNTAIGNKALFLNTLGQYNTALGDSSLFYNRLELAIPVLVIQPYF